MKYLLAFLLPLAAFAADPASAPQQAAPDYQQIAVLVRQQRDTATQALQDAQFQITMLQKQVTDLTAKVAELEKKPDPAKAEPDKRTALNLKTETVPLSKK